MLIEALPGRSVDQAMPGRVLCSCSEAVGADEVDNGVFAIDKASESGSFNVKLKIWIRRTFCIR